MPQSIGKVTAFVTRQGLAGPELLLFEHPYAGNQIPAGTMEEGESPEDAVIREVAEETGLTEVSVAGYLGSAEWQPPPGSAIIGDWTHAYARPDPTSFDWAYLRRGCVVRVSRRSAGFAQVTYVEHDRVPDPEYVTMQITGWVPDDVLVAKEIRYFYHLTYDGHTKDRWHVFSDNHTFTLFWAPIRGSISDLPDIVYPQNGWLAYLPKSLCP